MLHIEALSMFIRNKSLLEDKLTFTNREKVELK